MASNLVVVGYRDGRREKGSTFDFVPTKSTFHLESICGLIKEIPLAELKAVFFVRDLAGDPSRETTNEFDVSRSLHGRRIRVEFADGEVLVGTTQGYQPERVGFFVTPADHEANHGRVFVVRAATRSVTML
jgi:hypothetical protein